MPKSENNFADACDYSIAEGKIEVTASSTASRPQSAGAPSLFAGWPQLKMDACLYMCTHLTLYAWAACALVFCSQ